MIFNKADNLIKAVEAQLIGERNPIDHQVSSVTLRLYMKLQIYMNRLVRFPVKFLWMGISEILKSIYVWFILTGFAFFILAAWFFNNPINVQTEAISKVAFWLILLFPMFLVIFAMPSGYGDSGVSPKSVEFVVNHLKGQGFTTAKEIELLQKSVKPREDRVRSRVTALKWIVSLIWAGFIYTVPKDWFVKATPVHPVQIQIVYSAILLLLVVLTYLCVWGYEAALDKLFRAIEFGCNDFCFHLLQQEKVGTPRDERAHLEQ
jgi:hypothetical protein